LALAQPGEYNGTVNTITKIVQQDGFLTLFRGLTPALIGIVPYCAIDLGVYNTLKDLYAKRNPNKTPGIITVLSCGAISSTSAQLASYPLGLVRTRLQAQGMRGRPILYHGMMDCFVKTIKNEGFVGLYKGIVPNLLKAVPAISISYSIYEITRKKLGI